MILVVTAEVGAAESSSRMVKVGQSWWTPGGCKCDLVWKAVIAVMRELCRGLRAWRSHDMITLVVMILKYDKETSLVLVLLLPLLIPYYYHLRLPFS